MKNLIISGALGLGLLAPFSSALAYTLPSPVTVTAKYAGGSGEVDLSRPSSVSGTFKVDNNSGDSIWITAGDTTGGHSGYGFFVNDDKLYGVTRDEQSQALVFLGFVPTGRVFTVKADYTPSDGVRFDTASIASDWSQYSRGILMSTLPNPWMSGLGAFNASVTNRNYSTNLWVGSWSYSS